MRKALLLVVLLSVAAPASFIYPFPRQVCLRRADLVVLGQVVSEWPGPDFEPEPSHFMYFPRSPFRNPNFDRRGKLGLLRVDRWFKGGPGGEVRVVYSARESQLNKEPSIWTLQWNEVCKAYQFDFLFGPSVDDAPVLDQVLKEQAEQVMLDDQHGIKYLIQPLDSIDGLGRDVKFETLLEGDLSQVRLEVSADGRPVDPEQLNDFHWGFISIPHLSDGDHTISIILVNGPHRTTAGPFVVTVEN